MPFVKGDININRQGRPTADRLVNPTSLTKTEVREKEFKQILRRLKPINNKIIAEFEKMFMDDNTTEASRIKIGVFLLKTYTDMIDDVYKVEGNRDDEDKDELNQSKAPIIMFERQK